MTTLTIPAKDGRSFSAYIAMPKVTPAPAIIMIQEIFGVNAEMRKKCDDMAALGYIAAAPDLFWRMEPGVDLTDKTEAEWKKAFDFLGRFDVDSGIDDLRTTLHTLRGHADTTGVVGCIGYCLGGKLAYLMACRSAIDCAISYYGVGIEDLLDNAIGIKNPLLMHIAEEDKFVSKAAQGKIVAALSLNPHVMLHSYPGVNHAFSRTGGEHYDEAATKLAHQRTIDFLSTSLKKARAA